MGLLVNLDVPDLAAAERFYTAAFGLTVVRHLGPAVAELSGWPVPVFLLCKAAGSLGAGGMRRDYARHWTRVHLDVVVTEIDAAVATAVAAGAVVEQAPAPAAFGWIAQLADPFGHGLCLIQFVGAGYDAIGAPAATA